jgi:hypothetical protein
VNAHTGFDTTVVHVDNYWELWSIWCVGRLLGCYRARYDQFAMVEQHQREMVGHAWTHAKDESARAAALDVHCSQRHDGHAVTTFHDAAHAVRFFARGHGNGQLTAAAVVFVSRVDATCKDTSHYLPDYDGASREFKTP